MCTRASLPVISSTTSTANPTHADVLVFLDHADAKAAVARIGGDDTVAAPTPIKTLRHVAVEELAGLT